MWQSYAELKKNAYSYYCNKEMLRRTAPPPPHRANYYYIRIRYYGVLQ
jgi:hypothetical protein